MLNTGKTGELGHETGESRSEISEFVLFVAEKQAIWNEEQAFSWGKQVPSCLKQAKTGYSRNENREFRALVVPKSGGVNGFMQQSRVRSVFL